MSFDPVNFGDLARRAALLYPGKVVMEQDDLQLTYGELERRTQQVAALLARLGIAPGERVLLLFANDYRFAEALLGTLRAGDRGTREHQAWRRPARLHRRSFRVGRGDWSHGVHREDRPAAAFARRRRELRRGARRDTGRLRDRPGRGDRRGAPHVHVGLDRRPEGRPALTREQVVAGPLGRRDDDVEAERQGARDGPALPRQRALGLPASDALRRWLARNPPRFRPRGGARGDRPLPPHLHLGDSGDVQPAPRPARGTPPLRRLVDRAARVRLRARSRGS